jgi:hypothetical protein
MTKLAKSIPVFGFLYSSICVSCPEVWRTWDTFSADYANDSHILLVTGNCSEHENICHSIVRATSYPAFFQIFAGALESVRIERSLADFRGRADLLAHFDPALKCRPFWNQSGDYPIFGVSLPVNQSTACDQLLDIENRIPEVRGRLFLGYPQTRAYIKMTILVSRDYFSEQWINNSLPLLEDYIRDHLVPTLGNWSFNMANHITQRRFGFLIYASQSHIGQAGRFALNLIERFCFGVMPLEEFHIRYPNIALAESELPAIAIVNKERTKFRIIRDLIFDDYLEIMLSGLAMGLPDPEMIHRYRENLSPEGALFVLTGSRLAALKLASILLLGLSISICGGRGWFGKGGKWFLLRAKRLRMLFSKTDNRSAGEIPLLV